MGKKQKAKQAAALEAQQDVSARSVFWLPSFVLLAVAAYVVLESLQAHDFAHRAYFVQNDALNALSMLCFGAAGLLALVAPLRTAFERHLDRLSKAPLATHLLWIGSAFLGFMVWLDFIRYCQFRAFLLPQDTTCNVNTAYTFLHHGVLEWPIWGMKVFSLHFLYQWAVFSPALLIWNSPVSLLFVQNFFVCSAPFAAYALATYLTESSAAGFVGLVLAASTPYLYELVTSNMHNAALCAFFPWMMFFLYLRRWELVALFVFLMIGSVEQVPFTFLGLGIYAVYGLRDRKPRNWLYGAAISIAALALFVIEQKIKNHYASLEGFKEYMGAGQWQLLSAMVPNGTPEAQVPHEMLAHPLRTASMMLSIYKYFPILRVLFSMGLLAFAAPMAMIPFFVTVGPQVLAAPGSPSAFFDYHPITYYDFGLHHGAYMFGPLLWATAFGIQTLRRKLSAKGWQSWLLVWALAVSGVGFKYAHRTLNPSWRAQWFDQLPPLMARIPPKARVWVDEYASAPLANRRWIKITQWGPDSPNSFENKLFTPDYVILDKAFAAAAQPPYRDRMLTFYAEHGYVKDAEIGSSILLKLPTPDADPESVPAWVELPVPDAKKAQAYGQYLLAPLRP